MAARPGLCCGLRGMGGIPTMYRPGTQTLVGVEAVIDKDRASWVLAKDLHADTLVIATDTDAVYVDWGTAHQRPIRAAHPDELGHLSFPAGSMGPKVEAVGRLRPDHRRSSSGRLTTCRSSSTELPVCGCR